MNYIIKMTRLRIVDNSNIGRAAELAGKPAKCIHVYNKQGIGYLGDKVMPHICLLCSCLFGHCVTKTTLLCVFTEIDFMSELCSMDLVGLLLVNFVLRVSRGTIVEKLDSL